MAKITIDKLTEWYQTCGPELRLYALQWHGEQVAEDVVQDAFIQLLKMRRCPDRVRPWLFRVVRNGAVTRLRQEQTRKKARDRFPQIHGWWFEAHPDEGLDARQAQAVLQTLPAECREIVVMRIWGQLSFREIADIIEKSIPWVHRQYKTALGRIKQGLEASSCRTRHA